MYRSGKGLHHLTSFNITIIFKESRIFNYKDLPVKSILIISKGKLGDKGLQ